MGNFSASDCFWDSTVAGSTWDSTTITWDLVTAESFTDTPNTVNPKVESSAVLNLE